MKPKGYLLFDIAREQYFMSLYSSEMFTKNVPDAKIFEDKITLFATLEILRDDKINLSIPFVSVIEVF